MSGRESVAEKAVRLLADGCVLVERAVDGEVLALVAGDTGVYEVEVAGGVAWCSCRATRRCAHLVALELVTGPVDGTAAA